MTATISQDDAEAMATAPPAHRSRGIDPRGDVDWSGLYWISRDASATTQALDPHGLSLHAN